MPQQATVLANTEQALLLDIRPAADFNAGRVIGSKNIPFADLTKRMSELEKFKTKPIVIICKTGQTSSGAANQLKKAEFPNVSRMTGGMAEWTGQGLPLVRRLDSVFKPVASS